MIAARKMDIAEIGPGKIKLTSITHWASANPPRSELGHSRGRSQLTIGKVVLAHDAIVNRQ